MPIRDFEGSTFVAFLDISGFKELMRIEEKAWFALDRLYQSGYDILKNSRSVEGLFVSDSGILFVRDGDNLLNRFDALLKVIQQINRDMLEAGYLLTTSIAFGEFKYQERIEFPGIGKSPIYGNAYVQAYMDNSSGSPKIEPGFCRLVVQNLPRDFSIEQNDHNLPSTLQFLRKRNGDKWHKYFYWNVNNPNSINDFEKEYTNSYQLKFEGMLKALRNHL